MSTAADTAADPEGRRGVLVTGGTGHVGRLALEALATHGAGPLVSLDVRAPAAPRAGVVEVRADVRDADLVALLRAHAVAAVVHCAAIVTPPPGMGEDELHAIEVGGTRRLVAACVEAGVQHLTMMSSGAAYGYHPRNRLRPLVESDSVPGSPGFAYSRHKAEVETLLAEARREHPGLGQLVLRPGTILGAGTSNQITALFERPVVLGLRGVEVAFVLVWDRDVAEVVARGVTERVTGTFNLAGDGVLTLADIAAIEGRRLVRVPPALIAAALQVLDRLGVGPYGPEQVDFLRYRPVLSNDALKAAFPGLPTRSTREAYEAYRRGRDDG